MNCQLADRYHFSFDIEKLPQPFEKPVTIIAGRQDAVVGYCDSWEILENYPHASFVVLDRAGHGLTGEQQSLFRALAEDWLDRVTAG